ncbi:MAG: phosphate signaling complex protein PhoU [Planctomycetota bacterium]
MEWKHKRKSAIASAFPQQPDPARQPQAGSDAVAGIASVKRRLIRQSTVAIGMLEAAIDALWALDAEVAQHVRDQDNQIDAEEVAIEQACYDVQALTQPVARDFRIIASMLKVNHDVERVADHACSIAKSAIRISKLSIVPRFPMSLRDLAERVPATCHSLLRALIDEDTEIAREIVAGDKLLDKLDSGAFTELTEQIAGGNQDEAAAGLLLFRVGRDLERVGDLMKNIAEDLVYLDTGKIVRHQKRKQA